MVSRNDFLKISKIMPPIQDVTDNEFYNTYNYIKERLPTELSQPKVAIICGSGLGGLADTIDETKCKKVEFKYEDIPGFVTSTG
jgi:purine-nucleoside phosphorylase